MNIERRKPVRYQIKPHTIFVYSAYAPVQGWGKDICKEGMAFEYMSNGECEPKPEIRLILTGDAFPFYLPDLPCKTIYDVEVDNNVVHDKKRYGLRRCGMKFEKLDPDMQEKLTFLLNSKHILQKM
jgi:c-di-GMP-binding flagellar brake protein YcgR